MTVDIKISVIVAWHIQFVCMYRIKGKSHVMSGLLLFFNRGNECLCVHDMQLKKQQKNLQFGTFSNALVVFKSF